MDDTAKKKLLIIGASGHGRVVAGIALMQNKWDKIAFLDDNKGLNSFMGLNIIGNVKDASLCIDDYDIFVAIGDNGTREKISNQIAAAGASIPKLIHPCATIGEKVVLGAGTVVMAGVVINCSTTIGKGSIINTGATIDHDNIIEEYVHISPGVHTAGAVKIGKSSWIGIGAIVSNNISIVPGSVVGAGAVVIKDIIEAGVYIGVPAKKSKRSR